MLQVIAFLTIFMSMAAGITKSTALFALLATFILPAVSFFENRSLYLTVADKGYAGQVIVASTLLRSLGNGALVSFAAYGFGFVIGMIWL